MMSGRYSRLIGVAILAAALCIPASALAATGVNNLVLSPNGEFTELTVVGGGNTLCNHFTEPARNGTPFRIVLDFCDASHQLGQMHFANLPASRIERIRTSQFETSPKMIVRVVLDMADEATYSVVRDGTSLTVRVVDPGRATFAVWNANDNTARAQKPVMASTESQHNVRPEKVTTEATSDVVQPQSDNQTDQAVVATKPESPSAGKMALESPQPTGDAEPTAVPERSRVEAFIPPETPLVFAPDVLENPDKLNATSKPVEDTDEIVVSKESMQPLGPEVEEHVSAGERAERAASEAQWATTREPEPAVTAPSDESPVFANDESQQFAATTPNDMSGINEEETLLERLKQKFFGEQTAPRPYTTVGEGALPDEVQGPPAPDSKISREELLARIREAQKRVASGEYRRGGEGAGGIPTRQILYYDDMGRRDPFDPLVTGQRSGFVTNELPNVETLRLVGILRDDHEALALLENLEGYGYILRVGDPVKNGSLIAIQNRRALFRIDDYGWTHTVALQLTSRGTDPSKSLGAVPQEYPTYESETEGNENNGKSTGNQGSEGE
ncbi:MAG: AMIN domain-containing protein [candidate division Zixibacteria bacterium]|nr:AMIN domain-containing protein [candidate division Zixibacteria bacterium]